MKIKLLENHLGEGTFPTFPKGSKVDLIEKCNKYLFWYKCEINGYITYIHKELADNGYLIRDYNPTELVGNKDEVFTLLEIFGEWIFVADLNNTQQGWLPTSKVICI